MSTEETLVKSALNAWTLNIKRADTLFSSLSEGQLLEEVAPGRNRLIYLWGHLTAVHDAILPLLGLGARLHPELDAIFITSPDKSVPDLPSAAELKHHWDEVSSRLLAGISNFTASEWADRHTAVSPEDFAINPLRNRFSVLLNRTSHLGYHLGQAALVSSDPDA
jgi:hypothetical protein